MSEMLPVRVAVWLRNDKCFPPCFLVGTIARVGLHSGIRGRMREECWVRDMRRHVSGKIHGYIVKGRQVCLLLLLSAVGYF